MEGTDLRSGEESRDLLERMPHFVDVTRPREIVSSVS